jgi:hypothetical protein
MDNGQEQALAAALETKEVFPPRDDDTAYGGFPFYAWLAVAGELLPAWWSQARDNELRKFWKLSDHLSGTVNTLRDMMVAMPVKVVARDNTIKSYVREAEEYTRILQNNSESRSNFTVQGWPACYGAFIEDYHTIDNGAFMVIEGPGRGDEPLQGPPTKLIHLDGCDCWRTQNPEYPIIYTDMDGARYRLHKSRVINLTPQSAPIGSMYGVGFCAVSRAVNVAQNLIDEGRYKQEKLGSRPYRGMVAIEGGDGSVREATAVSVALRGTDEVMDNQGLTRYAKLPVAAVKGAIRLLDFASLPDGFDSMTDTQLGMAVLALAFGVDMRQLAFAFGVAGQTKADAEVQHLKMRGKGPGVIIGQATQQIEAKFLPPYLRLVFDYQDDEQDKLNADIRNVRSERREKDLSLGVTDIRTEREAMVESGEITEAQFIAMELADGRTPDGEDVLALFQSPEYTEVLPPLDATPEQIEEAILTMQRVLMSNARSKIKVQASMALAALQKLKGLRMAEPMMAAEPEPDSEEMVEEEEPEDDAEEGMADQDEKALSRITYNGITVMASGQRASTRPDKKYMRTVRYQGKERVVHYGDPNMTIKRSDPERRKAFMARHNCDSKKDPFAPGFWSCVAWEI